MLVVAVGRSREPLAGRNSSGPPLPSAPSSKPRKPPRSTRSSTTAPAPSPKSTSVERSVQSRILESMSPPTTSARCDEARGEHAVGLGDRVHEARAAGREVVRGGVRHPEHVGEERRRGGKRHVGRDGRDDQQVDAGRHRRPPSRAPCGRPAARCPTSPRCRRRSRRSRIPVRSRIHSSDVSTSAASSSFVTTRSGTWQPRPVIEIGLPFVRADHFAHREGQRAAHRELAADRRAHLALADRAAHRLDLAREVEHLARAGRSA